MWNDDITFCATPCPREDCRRNLGYARPKEKYISISEFDKDNTDVAHKKCESFYRK